MESSSGTVDLLQRQLMAQAIAHRETAVAQGASSQELDPALELAYLRNVLYEYMMGKQPLILAKVIAAVARFDADQTQNVIHKEEQKQSLVST
jgi:1-pyrroline-5-carboxylate dehydrogenase